MASCSQYAAAFGYQLFIVPVSACGVDLGAVNGGIQVGGFIDPNTLLNSAERIEAGADAAQILAGDPGSNIVYDNDTVTSETVIRLYGLTNASLETDTGSETVTTYDTESKGFDQNVAVSKSWSLSLEGVSQFTDAGYKTLRLLEQNAVAGALKVKIGRIGPTGTTEAIYGYATLTGFSESIEAGSIVSWSVTAEGYGPYAIDLDNSGTINNVGPINAFTYTAGSNLADGVYPALSLDAHSADATVDVTVSGGVATDVTLSAAGSLYQLGDAQLDASSISPAANPQAGEALTINVANAGTDVADGTYSVTNYSYAGTGSGLELSVTVTAGAVTSTSITDGGLGYVVGETLVDLDATAAANPSAGAILTSSIDNGGTGYAEGVYPGVELTGGNGASATADITVDATGSITVVVIQNPGTGYVAGDQLSADDADLGNLGTGINFSIDIDTVDENATLPGFVPPSFEIATVAPEFLTPVLPVVTVTSLVNDND